MLTGKSRRWLLVVLPLAMLVLVIWNYRVGVRDWIDHRVPYQGRIIPGQDLPDSVTIPASTTKDADSTPTEIPEERLPATASPAASNTAGQFPSWTKKPVSHNRTSHTIIDSLTTPDKKYFQIRMANSTTIFNPNVILHPALDETYILVAQQDGRAVFDGRYYSELFCLADFNTDNSLLECYDRPIALLIPPPRPSNYCTGDSWLLNIKIGPSDGRLGYGPNQPFLTWRQQSSYTCMSLWAQDFQVLALNQIQFNKTNAPFCLPAELQRPPPYGLIEKNWFLFWDNQGQFYAHYDLGSKRVFSRLANDGSASSDLAPLANDSKCLTNLMPKVDQGKDEAIHQGTNALLITLCNRADPDCVRTDNNTVIFHIFQLKTEQFFHALYEPYVYAFGSVAPFATYGVSRKPFWINGRLADKDMIYITSMSWKYNADWHGYLDDVLLVSFGIEDNDAAGIDFRASDLFDDLATCE